MVKKCELIFSIFIIFTFITLSLESNSSTASSDNFEGGETSSETEEIDDSISVASHENSTSLDSHEAMNNRGQGVHDSIPKGLKKPTLTSSDGGDGNRRKKRSYQFLMGLVKKNNSSYEITRNEKEFGSYERYTGDESDKSDSDAEKKSDGAGDKTKENVEASEILLELLVKIAEKPEQWLKVHSLLQKLDKDLERSKTIIEKIRNKEIVDVTADVSENDDNINQLKKLEKQHEKLTVTSPAQFGAYQNKNFAYHRVTGNPLNKKPKAYIAVSVIAPKSMQSEVKPTHMDETILENELKELKPWTHQGNLKNMADIRSNWLIQSRDKSNNEQ